MRWLAMLALISGPVVAEEVGRVVGVVEDVRRRRVDRDGAGVRRGVGALLAGVDREGPWTEGGAGDGGCGHRC